MGYRTCSFIRDDGSICNSAAVTDHSLCLYHLRHRARLMRIAQYRAQRVARASDALAKKAEDALCKDARAVIGSFRPLKPSASIGIAPQREGPLVIKVQVPVLS